MAIFQIFRCQKWVFSPKMFVSSCMAEPNLCRVVDSETVQSTDYCSVGARWFLWWRIWSLRCLRAILKNGTDCCIFVFDLFSFGRLGYMRNVKIPLFCWFVGRAKPKFGMYEIWWPTPALQNLAPRTPTWFVWCISSGASKCYEHPQSCARSDAPVSRKLLRQLLPNNHSVSIVLCTSFQDPVLLEPEPFCWFSATCSCRESCDVPYCTRVSTESS